MTTGIFTAIAITGFTVAFLHAAIPTHWLPFVVAARAQHWNPAKTLVVTGIAGSGHVLFTTALGVVVAWGGIAINAKWSRTFPLIAGGALIAVGLSTSYHDSRAVTGMCICLAGLVIMSGTSIMMMLIYTGIMRTMTFIIITNTTRSKRSSINGRGQGRIGR